MAFSNGRLAAGIELSSVCCKGERSASDEVLLEAAPVCSEHSLANKTKCAPREVKLANYRSTVRDIRNVRRRSHRLRGRRTVSRKVEECAMANSPKRASGE